MYALTVKKATRRVGSHKEGKPRQIFMVCRGIAIIPNDI